MSATGATSIAQISAILEKVILPTIQDQLFSKTVLLSKLKKNPGGLTFKNNEIYITATSSGHSGVAFTGGTGAIPVGKPTKSQMKAAAKFGYGSHILWDEAIQAAQGIGGDAIVNLTTEFGRDLETEFRRSLNRQLFGNGEGVLTTVTSGAASSATHTVGTSRNLRVGQKLLIGTKAEIEAGTADSVVVQTVNSDTSVTFTAAVTTATGDRVVTVGVFADSEYKEMVGLDSLISNNTESAGSTVQNIARATNDWANAYVDTSSAVLTEAQMIAMITAASEYGNPDLIVTTPALRNKYASLLQGQRRYQTMNLEGGFIGLEVAVADRAIPLVADFDAPTGKMFCLTTEDLGIAELNPLEYLRSGSGGIMTDVYDVDGNRLPAFQTTMKFYGNLVAKRFRSHSKLSNKTAS